MAESLQSVLYSYKVPTLKEILRSSFMAVKKQMIYFITLQIWDK